MDTRDVGKIAQGTILYQGRYRIDLLLTRTPHRAIYRAWDLSRNRAASIVEYAPCDDATVTTALERAAPLVQLDHHTLTAFQVVFVEHDTVFAALTFAGGQTIEHIMAERAAPIPPAAAVRWISQVAEMLEFFASALPTWHLGDLSGGALFVTAEDRAQSLSFEIPLGLLTPAQVAADLPADAVAPELSQGQCDARSDVYSLAATLHLLLTRQAWAGGDPAVNTTLETLQPSLPHTLIDTVRHALALDPAARWSDAAAFHGALLAALAAPTTEKQDSIFPGMPAQPLHEEPATLATPRDALRAAVAAEATARGEALPPWLAAMAATSATDAATNGHAPSDSTPQTETPPAVNDAHSSANGEAPAALDAPANSETPAAPETANDETPPVTPPIADAAWAIPGAWAFAAAREPHAITDAQPETIATTTPADTAEHPVANVQAIAGPTTDAPSATGEQIADAAPPANNPPASVAPPLSPWSGVIPSIEGASAIFARPAPEPAAPTSNDATSSADGDAVQHAVATSGSTDADAQSSPDLAQEGSFSESGHMGNSSNVPDEWVGHAIAPMDAASTIPQPLPGTEAAPVSPLLPLAAAASGAAIIAAIGGRFSSLPPLEAPRAEPVAEPVPAPEHDFAATTPSATAATEPVLASSATEPLPQRADLGMAPASETVTNAMWGTLTPDILDNLGPTPPHIAQPVRTLDDVQPIMSGPLPTPAIPEAHNIVPASAQTDTAPAAIPAQAENAGASAAPTDADASELANEPPAARPPWGAIAAAGGVGVVGAALWAQHDEKARQKEETAAAPPPPQEAAVTPTTDPTSDDEDVAHWFTSSSASAPPAAPVENDATTSTHNGSVAADAEAMSHANGGVPHYDDSDWLNAGPAYVRANSQPLAPETPPATTASTAYTGDPFAASSTNGASAPEPSTSSASTDLVTPAGNAANGYSVPEEHAHASDAEIIAAALGGAAAFNTLAPAHDAPAPAPVEQMISAHPDAMAPATTSTATSFAPTHSPITTPLPKTPSRPLMDRIRQILQPPTSAPSMATGTIVVPRHMYAQNSYSILVRLQVRTSQKQNGNAAQQRPLAIVEVEASPDDAFYLPVRRLALPIPLEGGLSEGSLSVTAQRPTAGTHDHLTFTFKLSDGTILHKGQFVADVAILGPQQMASGEPMQTLIHPLDITF